MTDEKPPTAARGPSSWRRLARAGAPRGTKAQALGAALALALGFAIATQIQQTQESGLESMRQDDLVRVLDDVSQRSTRLDSQVRELQEQRDALSSGANSSQAAIDQATKQLETVRMQMARAKSMPTVVPQPAEAKKPEAAAPAGNVTGQGQAKKEAAPVAQGTQTAPGQLKKPDAPPPNAHGQAQAQKPAASAKP